MDHLPPTFTSDTVVFVDDSIPDIDYLIAALPVNVEWTLLNAHENGFAQMAAYLRGRTGLDSVQLISHGSPGAVIAGSSVLNLDTIDCHRVHLEVIGAALDEKGDLLLYGCRVAQGDAGEKLVRQIAAITHANVAASKSPTGAAALGGDWMLEYGVGAITTKPLALSAYADVLAVTCSPI